MNQVPLPECRKEQAPPPAVAPEEVGEAADPLEEGAGLGPLKPGPL